MTDKTDVRMELDGRDADKFEDILEWMKKESDRTSKAAAGRTAVRLAHEKLEDLEEERSEMGENIREYERKKKKYLP